MFDLFNQASVSDPTSISNPEHDRMLGLQKENCTRVINHYRRADYSVPSDHFLVRLIEVLPPIENKPLLVYRGMIEDVVDDIVRVLNLSSSINIGQSAKPGIFMGDDSEEIIIAAGRDFSISEITNNWQNLEPVRYVRHPKSDLNLMPPMGKATGMEIGPSVILIDIPMLACQYQKWRQRELRINPEFPLGIQHFVAKFPIPNMLRTYHDIAYLNILMKVYNGERVSKLTDNHPFYINNRTDDIIKGVEDIVDVYKGRRIGFMDLLESLRSVHAETLRKSVQMPTMPNTRQIIWALVIARLPIVSFMLDWNEEQPGSPDRQEMNNISRSLRRLRGERALSSLVSEKLQNEIKETLQNDIQGKT